MDKRALRSRFKERRHALDPLQKKADDQSIQSQTYALLTTAQTIGIYLSFGDEIDTMGLISQLQADGKTVAIPKTIGKTMHFRRFESLDQCDQNAFGIWESKGEVIAADAIDVLVVPMLAYTLQGYRLGYGGGYYDRYLAHFKGLSIGLAYDSFQFDGRFVDTYDIPCNIIVTNREVKKF